MVGDCNYVHARIQEFLPVGDHARLPENSFDNVFDSPQLISQFYSGLSMVYFKENYNFVRFQKGVYPPPLDLHMIELVCL